MTAKEVVEKECTFECKECASYGCKTYYTDEELAEKRVLEAEKVRGSDKRE